MNLRQDAFLLKFLLVASVIRSVLFLHFLYVQYPISKRKILDRPTLTAQDIPPGTKWALLLDPYTLNFPYYSVLKGEGFEFVAFSRAN
jgi:hypothetical protein